MIEHLVKQKSMVQDVISSMIFLHGEEELTISPNDCLTLSQIVHVPESFHNITQCILGQPPGRLQMGITIRLHPLCKEGKYRLVFICDPQMKGRISFQNSELVQWKCELWKEMQSPGQQIWLQGTVGIKRLERRKRRSCSPRIPRAPEKELQAKSLKSPSLEKLVVSGELVGEQ